MKISDILNMCDREYTNAVHHSNASKQSQFTTIVPKIPYRFLQIKSKNIWIRTAAVCGHRGTVFSTSPQSQFATDAFINIRIQFRDRGKKLPLLPSESRSCVGWRLPLIFISANLAISVNPKLLFHL